MTPRDVQTARLSEKLRRELGPVVLKALSDPDVIEIILNPDGRIWVESHTAGMSQTDASMAPTQAEKSDRNGCRRAQCSRESSESDHRGRTSAHRQPFRGFASAHRAVAMLRDQKARIGPLHARPLPKRQHRNPRPSDRFARCHRQAPEHRDRRRNRLRENHARQRTHSRDGQSGRSGRALRHHRGHVGASMRRAQRAPTAYHRRRGYDSAGTRDHATQTRPGSSSVRFAARKRSRC